MSTGTLDIAWEIQGLAPTTGTLTLSWPIEDFRPSTSGTLDLSWSLAETQAVTLMLEGAPSGLVGVLTVELIDEDNETVYGPTTMGIVEFPVSSGRYEATLNPAPDPGTYSVVWSDGVTSTGEIVIITLIPDVTVTYPTIAPGRIGLPDLV